MSRARKIGLPTPVPDTKLRRDRRKAKMVDLNVLILAARENYEAAEKEFQDTDCHDAMEESNGWRRTIKFLEAWRKS